MFKIVIVDCDCDLDGAEDNDCQHETGQCHCKLNITGKKCDKCEDGHWNFPDCRQCECNGHSETCDQATGACLECSSNTSGLNCEKCIDDFYGDALLGTCEGR